MHEDKRMPPHLRISKAQSAVHNELMILREPASIDIDVEEKLLLVQNCRIKGTHVGQSK